MQEADAPIKLGVSACLLGRKVRYNGEHARDRYVCDELGRFAVFVPVCPEVECGLGVPRESMRLVGDPDAPRLVGNATGTDYARRMEDFCARRAQELEAENLDGFIFKSRSPTSGMARVKVYDAKGAPKNVGVGLFARAFTRRFPLIPVEEEGRLNDPRLRENFIERVFTLARWRKAMAGLTGNRSRDAALLKEFHARHKLLLMARSPQRARRMGRIAAEAGRVDPAEIAEAYLELLMAAMALAATPAKHVNVMQHVMGYFKKKLTGDEKAELLETMEAYRRGLVPLVVPLTLLGHYVRKFDEAYLTGQWYLRPHPAELGLRNHV